MTVASHSANRYLDRPAPSSLADVIDTILDQGLVIDIYARVSLLGIELLTMDARIVIASVDTYLRFAEAVNRLDIAEADQKPAVTDLPRVRSPGRSHSDTRSIAVPMSPSTAPRSVRAARPGRLSETRIAPTPVVATPSTR
jgi:hypothetical protein